MSASEKLRFLNVKSGEWGLIIPLVLLLATNTLVFELSEVVATTGFISQIGTPRIIYLWLVTLPITIIVASGYALVVDRIKRVTLMTGLLIGFAALYCIALILFSADAPDWLKYPALYLLTELQYAVFPLAFWALAGDMYTMTEARRLFPIVATGGALGSIIGNALAAALTRLLPKGESNAPQVLALGVLVFLGGLLVLRVTFRKRTVRARQAKQSGGIRDTIKEGWGVIKGVPMFRYLAAAMLMMGLALMIVEFHFLYSLDKAAQEADNAPKFFQSFYGIYKALLIGGTLLFQSLITGRYLEKAGTKNSFVGLPLAFLMGLGVVAAVGGAVGVAAGRLIMRVVQRGWDEPARKSAQSLVPDERRGRVSTFMDNYFYSFASILGCLFVGGLLLATDQDVISRETTTIIYLAVAGAAALGAVWATLKLRTVYDKSLLNWRLSRSRRKSVLDGIEF